MMATANKFLLVSCSVVVSLNLILSRKIDHKNWVDLTHPLSPEAPVYTQVYQPLFINPEKSKATDSWPGKSFDGIFVSWRFMEFYEHTGTHVDAPRHFSEGGRTEDQLTWEDLTGPLVVVNAKHKMEGATGKVHLEKDIFEKHVEENEPIEPKSFIFINTGWTKYYWTDKEKYYKEAVCLGESAIDWILENAPDLLGVGVETLSPECNDNSLFRLHRVLLPNDQLIIENVGPGLDKLPPTGANLMIFPMHLKDGTGSPARLIAVNTGRTVLSSILAMTSIFISALLML